MAGNANSGPKREKPFRDALMVAIKRAEADASENPKSLARVADQLLVEAAKGNVPAIKELADRLDGKVPQGIIGGEDGENPVGLIVNVLRFTDADAGNRPAEQLEAPPVPAKPLEIP